jgi:CYTH domain-containing protein
MEIERKFLVAERPPLEGARSVRIEQGYLALDSESGVEVRLRRKGDELLLTVKGGAGLSRTEVEISLESAHFDTLWPLTEGRRLAKRRHLIPLGDLEVELDVYGAHLEGLVTAEVEFPDEAAADCFDKPDWLGKEVTGEDAYLNRTLATAGAPA